MRHPRDVLPDWWDLSRLERAREGALCVSQQGWLLHAAIVREVADLDAVGEDENNNLTYRELVGMRIAAHGVLLAIHETHWGLYPRGERHPHAHRNASQLSAVWEAGLERLADIEYRLQIINLGVL